MQRIKYIDFIRGFSIFLVVFAHTSFFFLTKERGYFIFDLIGIFFMPLFFIISGYVGHTGLKKIKNRTDLFALLWKKTQQLLIPFFCVGLTSVITTSIFNGNYNFLKVFPAFFSLATMYGYWFLFILFWMIFISAITMYCINKFTKEALRKKNYFYPIVFIIIALTLKAIIKLGHITELTHIESFYFLGESYQYFLVGMLLKEHNAMLTFITNKACNAIAFMGIIALFIANYYFEYSKAINAIYAYICCIYIWGLFKKIQLNSFTEKLLDKCGQSSLEIYIFHYYFLLGLTSLLTVTQDSSLFNSFLITLCAILVMTIINITFSLCIAKVIKTNSILSKIILGK